MQCIADGAVHDEGGKDRRGCSVDAIKLKVRIGHGADHGDQQLKRFRRRTGHHGVDDQLLHRTFDIAGQHGDELVWITIILRQEGAYARIGWRHERETIAPAALQREAIEFLDAKLGLVTLAGEPIDLTALRSAIAADERLGLLHRAGARRGGSARWSCRLALAHQCCAHDLEEAWKVFLADRQYVVPEVLVQRVGQHMDA